ncbi:MAG: tetratricopeptide repeat protein [Bryobacterales bacterium]|nr:tetratricopeptide repeat protein [Bryobacterales bacterium]
MKGGGARRELVPYWPGTVTERDTAIAYAGAGVDHAELRGRALELMEKAERGSGNDAALLAQLAQYYDALGQGERAQGLYERALRIDPENVSAGANVAVYWAQRGRMAEAMAMWEKIAARHPGMSSVAVNLAVAQYGAGQAALAERTLERVLAFHPDLAVARKLLGEMRARGSGRR